MGLMVQRRTETKRNETGDRKIGNRVSKSNRGDIEEEGKKGRGEMKREREVEKKGEERKRS